MTSLEPVAASQIWKPLIVCPHRELSSRVRAALIELGIQTATHLADYPRMGSLNGLAAEGECNVCFLDVSSNPEHAMLLLVEAATSMPVVVLNTRKDADLILRCLHRGAGEFLAEPTTEQLRTALERLARLRLPAAPLKPSQMYCVVPGKPGCGASTLAAHLAIEFKRGGSARVLLVDTDVIGGSISFMLKLKAGFHLGDAVRDRQKMDADVWTRMTVPCHGIDILPAPDNPAFAMDLTRSAVGELTQFWRSQYETIVLDTSGAQFSVELARLSDQILMVTTNELVPLHATRRSMEYLEQSGIERKRLRLIVNRYSPGTGLKRDEVQTALKVEPCALLANEYETVQQAVLEGRPVDANARYTRGLRTLAARLGGKEPPVEKKPAWLGLLPKRS